MNIKIISIIFFSINTLKMLKKDSPIFQQNINMIARQLFFDYDFLGQPSYNSPLIKVNSIEINVWP